MSSWRMASYFFPATSRSGSSQERKRLNKSSVRSQSFFMGNVGFRACRNNPFLDARHYKGLPRLFKDQSRSSLEQIERRPEFSILLDSGSGKIQPTELFASMSNGKRPLFLEIRA